MGLAGAHVSGLGIKLDANLSAGPISLLYVFSPIKPTASEDSSP